MQSTGTNVFKLLDCQFYIYILFFIKIKNNYRDKTITFISLVRDSNSASESDCLSNVRYKGECKMKMLINILSTHSFHVVNISIIIWGCISPCKSNGAGIRSVDLSH